MIIGLSGKMGCGKSTVARLVAERVPACVVMSFADAVREEVAALLEVPLALVRTQDFKGMHFRIGNRLLTGREVMQWWGTEVRRAADPNYWVKQAHARALQAIGGAGAKVVLIDDVRFHSEADMIRAERGLLFRIQPHDGWQPGANAAHQSEVDLDDYTGWDAAFCPEFGPHALEAVAYNVAAECLREMQEVAA